MAIPDALSRHYVTYMADEPEAVGIVVLVCLLLLIFQFGCENIVILCEKLGFLFGRIQEILSTLRNFVKLKRQLTRLLVFCDSQVLGLVQKNRIFFGMSEPLPKRGSAKYFLSRKKLPKRNGFCSPQKINFIVVLGIAFFSQN